MDKGVEEGLGETEVGAGCAAGGRVWLEGWTGRGEGAGTEGERGWKEAGRSDALLTARVAATEPKTAAAASVYLPN